MHRHWNGKDAPFLDAYATSEEASAFGYDRLVRAARSGAVSRAALRRSYERVLLLKSRVDRGGSRVRGVRSSDMHCGRKFHPILGLAAAAAALALATVAGAGSLPSLSDSFDDAATLSQWHFIEGDLQDGVAPTFDIGRTTPGELTIVPGRSWWVDGTRAFALMKPVRGDFVATLRLRVTGKDTASPSTNWSLSGLLVARVGSYFVFLRRFPGRSWSFNYSYRRRDLPAALTVGIDAFSGYGDTKADLVSHVDS